MLVCLSAIETPLSAQVLRRSGLISSPEISVPTPAELQGVLGALGLVGCGVHTIRKSDQNPAVVRLYLIPTLFQCDLGHLGPFFLVDNLISGGRVHEERKALHCVAGSSSLQGWACLAAVPFLGDLPGPCLCSTCAHFGAGAPG